MQHTTRDLVTYMFVYDIHLYFIQCDPYDFLQ